MMIIKVKRKHIPYMPRKGRLAAEGRAPFLFQYIYDVCDVYAAYFHVYVDSLDFMFDYLFCCILVI